MSSVRLRRGGMVTVSYTHLEELEEEEFAPMFEQCEKKLKGKKIALFGSYGWDVYKRQAVD